MRFRSIRRGSVAAPAIERGLDAAPGIALGAKRLTDGAKFLTSSCQVRPPVRYGEHRSQQVLL
jgi:hypothetical protein